MANNIFDWDDEEEKKAEDDVWGVPAASDPSAPLSTDWQETETVIRPRPEPWRPDQPVQSPSQPDTWADFPPDAFDQPPAQPGVWSEYKNESSEETARKGGLAWSAGIVFFSSVAFMLFLGWIADWLFGSSPWGLIGGIVLGSIVGFVQFFRISNRIFNPKKTENAERPLMTRDDGPV